MDENSLSSEEARENRDSIQKLSRDFRLKATELYLKITKEEFAFHEVRLQNLLDDFPHDKCEPPSAPMDTDEDGMDLPDEQGMDDGGFTQKTLPSPPEPSEAVDRKGRDKGETADFCT